jgi:hypothetical protein
VLEVKNFLHDLIRSDVRVPRILVSTVMRARRIYSERSSFRAKWEAALSKLCRCDLPVHLVQVCVLPLILEFRLFESNGEWVLVKI